MTDPVTFAARLRPQGTQAGLTQQQQLADAAGMPQASIARLESGGRAPSWETPCRLAEALGIGVEAFRYG